ncbi:MFS transporter [Paenibacillus sp. NFR01]|uniref:MFS transporter n=1 Tax=Paenibacillus sp. NFR01 TaxID=1566279 RepID=UPI0008B185C1|nr:MFS transporter [Paenibacillus sp. NFR01]SET96710.1 Major Facilitator Superfamily protein [Paenibacillus sp. NFR01]
MMKSLEKAGPGLLRNKVYVRVYTAYTVAAFGDWFDTLAIQVLAGYRWGVSPLMLALIPVAVALPGIALGALAGTAADRLNKLKLMRLCDLLTALITLFLLFAPNMYWLLPLLALRAAVSTLNVPAQQALTRSIVREDQLMQAASLNGIVNQGSKIAGPLLGGLALTLLSPQWCILLNFIMRLCSYGLLLTMKAPGTAAAAITVSVSTASSTFASPTSTSPASAAGGEMEGGVEERVPFGVMWKEGWLFILRTSVLRNTMIYGLIGMLAIQMIDFQFTSLFRSIAPDNEPLLGWMVAASGVTAVLTILAMNRRRSEGSHGRRLGSGQLLIGAAVGGLGLLAPGVPVYPVLLFGAVLGAGNGISMLAFNYCLQKETPPHMTGRVFGIQSTVLSAVMIVAPLLGGLLVEWSGPSRIFAVFGAAVAVIGLAGIALSPVLWPEAKRAAAEG